jgi:hypothetical protein
MPESVEAEGMVSRFIVVLKLAYVQWYFAPPAYASLHAQTGDESESLG